MHFTIRALLQENGKHLSSFRMVACWKWLLSQSANFNHRDNTGQLLPPLYSSNSTKIFQYQLVHCPCQLIFVFHRKCKRTYHGLGVGTPSNHMKLFTLMHRIEVALNSSLRTRPGVLAMICPISNPATVLSLISCALSIRPDQAQQ